ncbi:GerMN domain-containing protein [Bacillus shivajii]|uniref:GerMN domain-containing protein n=1 Tax=Bacillus shivajii TaxID=1983719 RepID=UPI001CF9BDF0|nr:GerMN domain-containing protein [Bacillus shivajii]UCZ53659.1 GerMN domain-containing protein [Bacillus shivajii]
MKKMKWLLLSLSFVLVLAACGQGDDIEEQDPADETTGSPTDEEVESGTEDDENSEVDTAESSEATEEEEDATEEDVAMIDNLSLYFADDQLMATYRLETDYSVTDNEAGAKEAMDLWVAGPNADSLIGLLPDSVQVQSVTFEGDTAYISFSNDILGANLGSSGELMLTEQIAMVMEQFGFNQTMILVDEETPETFLGHMDASEPIEANSPEEYELHE